MPASNQLNPSRILETGFAFWPSKVLLTAVELGVFTTLSKKPLTAKELGKALKLHDRGIYDFFDTLVSMNFLEREGNGPSAKYKNSKEAEVFLDKNQPNYIWGNFGDEQSTAL